MIRNLSFQHKYLKINSVSILTFGLLKQCFSLAVFNVQKENVFRFSASKRLSHRKKQKDVSVRTLNEEIKNAVDEERSIPHIAAKKPADEKTEKFLEILQAASTGGLETRGGLANAFNRCPLGAKSADYKGTREEKAAFRRRWAANKYQEVLMTREQEEGLSQIDKSKGTMKSIKALIKEEGIEDTRDYVMKCARLGAPWIEWDDMWERWNVMVMEKSHSEVFTRAWRLRQQRVGGDSSAGADSSQGQLPAPQSIPTPPAPTPAPSPAPTPQVPRPNAKSKGKGKGKGNDGKRKDGNPDPPPPAKKKATPLALANKLKTNYSAAISGAQNLLQVIRSSDAWWWANNEYALGDLKTAKDKVDKAVADSTFAHVFLTMNTAEVKKTTPRTS